MFTIQDIEIAGQQSVQYSRAHMTVGCTRMQMNLDLALCCTVDTMKSAAAVQSQETEEHTRQWRKGPPQPSKIVHQESDTPVYLMGN